MNGPAQGDLGYFLDADLSILGSSSSRYSDYAKAIRTEYKHIDWFDYLVGRQKVIEYFLECDPMYFTFEAQKILSSAARLNLLNELQQIKELRRQKS